MDFYWTPVTDVKFVWVCMRACVCDVRLHAVRCNLIGLKYGQSNQTPISASVQVDFGVCRMLYVCGIPIYLAPYLQNYWSTSNYVNGYFVRFGICCCCSLLLSSSLSLPSSRACFFFVVGSTAVYHNDARKWCVYVTWNLFIWARITKRPMR